jgi:cation transport regulator ChaB
MNIDYKTIVRSGLLIAACATAGCATTGTTGAKHVDEDNSVIRERSTQRWQLLIDKKADKAYDFLSPGFRATKTRDDYAREMNARGVRWNAVEFGSQECTAEKCEVRLVVQFKISMKGPMGAVQSTAPVIETWIKSDGRWYYLPEAMRSSKLQGDAGS